MKKTNTLYRIFTAEGHLLYVGATMNPVERLAKHAGTKPWWEEAAEVKLEHFATLSELLVAEEAAIKAERPQHNSIHTNYGPWRLKPRGPKGEGTVFQRGVDGLWCSRERLPPVDGKRRCKEFYGSSREEVEAKREQWRAAHGSDANGV